MILLYRLIDRAYHSEENSIERELLSFVFSKKESIRDISLEDFLKQTYLSKSTFQRFLRSLDLKSYGQFKTTVFREMEYLAQELEIKKTQIKKPEDRQIKEKILKAKRLFVYGSPEFLDVFAIYLPYILYLRADITIELVLFYEKAKLQEKDVVIFGSLFETPDLLWLQNVIYMQSDSPFQDHAPCYSIFIGRKVPAHQIHTDVVCFLNSEHSMAETVFELCRIFEKFIF